MEVEKKEIEQRMAHFTGVCRAAGIKLTHQRLEIFREVAKTADHPDTEKVYQSVRKPLPTVSLDTVYRTLKLLNGLKIVNILGPARGKSRYDANLLRHHHFVCVRCGKTRDFYSEELSDLKVPDSAKAFGNIETVQVEMLGVCSECAARENNPIQTKK